MELFDGSIDINSSIRQIILESVRDMPMNNIIEVQNLTVYTSFWLANRILQTSRANEYSQPLR